MRVPVGLVWLGRLAVAAVWLYEGLVAKLLGRRADELVIVSGVPLLGDHPRLLFMIIGGWELLLAIMVLLGRVPRLVAAAQTVTLVVFNTGGLVFARAEIADPAHLLVTNAVLLVLVWVVATALTSRRTPLATTTPTRETAGV